MNQNELENDFFAGKTNSIIHFAINDSVEVVSGIHKGEYGAVVSIKSIAPEIAFYIESGKDGSDIVVQQNEIIKVIKEKTVFVLLHENKNDDVKLIGVYSTKEQAQKARIRLTTKLGFKEFPEGFSVDEYPINKDHWVEGFISVD